MERKEVYAAIDGERAYQDSRWNSETTTSGGLHSFEEWICYIEDYLREAKTHLSRLPKQEADGLAGDIFRKVGAMTVSALEQHGCWHRQPCFCATCIPECGHKTPMDSCGACYVFGWGKSGRGKGRV